VATTFAVFTNDDLLIKKCCQRKHLLLRIELPEIQEDLFLKMMYRCQSASSFENYYRNLKKLSLEIPVLASNIEMIQIKQAYYIMSKLISH
jgi:hypothetical protein